MGSVVRFFALLIAAVAISGCGTTFQGCGLFGPAIYGGVRCDILSIAQEPELAALILVVDLPFSFLADTVILPWSIYNEIKRGGVKVKSIQETDFPFPFGPLFPKKKKEDEKQKEKSSKGKEKKSSKEKTP